MNKNIIEKYFFFLFSIIPISIIVGSTVSLVNILLIVFSFLINMYVNNDWKWIQNKTIRLLFFLYLYFIFNIFVSLDFTEGLNRNLGFLRFIFLFAAINYFFFYYENFKKVFIIWGFIFLFLCFDVFYESYFDLNILGYGKGFGGRVVSFFKDEAIVGGYIFSFYLIIIGYLFFDYKKNRYDYRYLFFLLSVIFILAIIFTGERSNSIRALIGFLLFYYIYFNFSTKKNLLIISIFSIIVITIIFNSNFLKQRYIGDIFYKTAAGIAMPQEEFDQLPTKEKLKKHLEQDIYVNLYKSGFAVFKNNLIFGVGNKNYSVETCTENYQKDNYYCITHPHQIYLEFLAEHGLFGSIILLSIFFILIFKILKIILISKNYLQLGCFIYLAITFFPFLPSGSFFGDFNSTIFWINLSIMYSVNRKTNIFNINK